MSQRYDITLYKNETHQTTFEYFDSRDGAIPLSSTNGHTIMTIRPLNDNDSTPAVIINTSVTTVPVEAGDPCFYFPAGSTNKIILYIPQPDAEAIFEVLNENQRYYYDIVATRVGGVKDRLIQGRFTAESGVSVV